MVNFFSDLITFPAFKNKIQLTSLALWKHHVNLLLQSFRSVIVLRLHSQKRASCNKSIDMILQQLVTTSRYQDVFASLETAC